MPLRRHVHAPPAKRPNAIRRSRRGARLIACAVVLVALPAAVPSAAHALAITSVDVPELVVDQAADITVHGDVPAAEQSYGIEVAVHMNPPTVGCASSSELDVAVNRTHEVEGGPDDAGPFSITIPMEPRAAEAAIICVYLWDVYSSTRTQLSVPAPVRQPHTSLQLAAPHSITPKYGTLTVGLTASAEVGRDVSVTAVRWDHPCGPTFSANELGLAHTLWDLPILGGPLAVTRQVQAPDEGHWMLCGYIGTDFTDTQPTSAVKGAPFWVGSNPHCHVGRVPRSSADKLALHCTTNAEGDVELRVRRGGHSHSITVDVLNGFGSVVAGRLGLPHGRAADLTVRQGETKLGSRRVRRP